MTAAHHSNADRWARWMTSWALLGLPGLCWAIVSWGAVTVVGIAAAVAVPLALVFVLTDHGRREWDGGPPDTVRSGWITRAVLCGVTLVLSSTAIGAAMPGLGFLLLVLAGCSTPPVADVGRRVLGHPPALHPPASAEEITSLPRSLPTRQRHEATARAMTDAQLCRAWRHSYWLLRETYDPAARLAVVHIRQSLLDEMENRNSAALEAWLASEPRPSHGPDEFLITNDEGERPSAA